MYAGGRVLGAVRANLAQPTVQFVNTTQSVGEAQSTATASVRLTTGNGAATTCPVTVTYHAVSGTASQADYGVTEGTLTFAPGTASGATQNVSLGIVNDSLDENDETFTLNLSGAVGAAISASASEVVTIQDDDAPPGLQVVDGAIAEGNSGTSTLGMHVQLLAPSGRTVQVSAHTEDRTATAGSDYVAASATLTFAPGVVDQVLPAAVNGDTTREIDETFAVTLSAPVNATLDRPTGIGTILDEDRPPIPPQSDFNGDGKPDLLWQHQGDGRLSVWLMNGLTQVSGPAPTPPQVADTAWKIVGTGDVDGDGDADVFWQNTTTGALSLWTMNGLQMVSGDPLIPSNAGDINWRVRAVADINHDGHPDLIWQHLTQGWVSVWTMNGRTMTEGHLLSPYALDTNWQVVGTGDLDQDGWVDLIWQHQTSGDLAWWRLDGYGQVSGAALSPGNVADLQWKIRGAADLDADGQTDLLWQHTSDGALAVWLMNGAALRTATVLTPSSVTDVLWWIVGPK